MSADEAIGQTLSLRRTRRRKGADFLPLMNDVLSIFDVTAGIVCGEIALGLYNIYCSKAPFVLTSDGPFLREIIFGSLLACAVLREPRLASRKGLFPTARLLPALRNRGVAVLILLLTTGLATRQIGDMARLWLLAWSTLFAFCVVASRVAFLFYVNQLVARGALREAVAVIHLSGSAGQLSSRISLEADVVVSVDSDSCDAANTSVDGVDPRRHPLGLALDSILALGREGAIDSVVVALGKDHHPELLNVVGTLKAIPVQIVVCPDPGWGAHQSPDVRLFAGIPMSVVASRPLTPWNLAAKTLTDKTTAVLLLLLAAPLILAICIALVIDNPGPVFFRQRRSGWHGTSFVMFKFRTMRIEGHDACAQTTRSDPRCTRVGGFLRRSSLDEIPQLLNVLWGNMSLVGPRPHVDSLHADQLAGQAIVSEYAQRYRVKPGMTGWAQINGLRGAASTPEQLRRRVEHDLFYIENWSLLFDLRILLLTPFAVFSGENAF